MTENTQISEENITAMVEAAQNIADDSTAMRQKMIAIEKMLRPIFKTAGIDFRIGQPYPTPEAVWIERNVPEAPSHPRWLTVRNSWGGKGLVISSGHERIGFANASRNSIKEAINHIPEFLLAYTEELEKQTHDIIDLREKAEAMLAIVEG